MLSKTNGLTLFKYKFSHFAMVSPCLNIIFVFRNGLTLFKYKFSYFAPLLGGERRASEVRRRRDYRDLEGEDAGGQGEEERGREEEGRGQGEKERGREEGGRGPGECGVSSNARLSVDTPNQVLMVYAIRHC
jgi:hypothetical protein